MIKDYLFAKTNKQTTTTTKTKTRSIRQGGEKEGFGPESENNSHPQGFQIKTQIKRNDALILSFPKNSVFACSL